MSGALREKAERLRALHQKGRPLVLVNAWDAATARILEKAGSAAIATTSAGIAFADGYPDGQKIPRERMLEAIGRICAAVTLPVTADMEAGYGDTPEELGAAARGVVEAGAVGLNLEDAAHDGSSPLVNLPVQLEKIHAIRQASRESGVPLVLNARTDAYLLRTGTDREMFDETVRRGEAFRDAGADCVFVPGVTDPGVIGALVRRLDCAVNVLAVAGSPPIGELASLGVARVSLGSGPYRASMSFVQRLAEEVLTRGTYSGLEGIVTYAAMNELMR